jgi:ketosteroid isomerase-like protein
MRFARTLAATLVLAACAVASAAPATAKPKGLSPLEIEDLLAADRLLTESLLRHDFNYVNAHIADDAVFVRASGKKLTKRMLIADAMEQPAVTVPVKLRYRQVSTRLDGPVAEVTMTATFSMKTTAGWQDLIETRVVGRFRKRGADWILAGSRELYTKKLR